MQYVYVLRSEVDSERFYVGATTDPERRLISSITQGRTPHLAAFYSAVDTRSFVAEPQGNGVVERFNRILKGQVVHGRVCRDLDELRDAVRQFVNRYNVQWLVEKNGFPSPQSGSEAVERGVVSQARRMTNLCPGNRGLYTAIRHQRLSSGSTGLAPLSGRDGDKD